MLVRDPKQRATAEQLLTDPWIKQNIDKKIIDNDTLLDISFNLHQFKKLSAFQAGIMTFIVSQNENFSDLRNLKDIFNKFDESNDGKLELKEI